MTAGWQTSQATGRQELGTLEWVLRARAVFRPNSPKLASQPLGVRSRSLSGPARIFTDSSKKGFLSPAWESCAAPSVSVVEDRAPGQRGRPWGPESNTPTPCKPQSYTSSPSSRATPSDLLFRMRTNYSRQIRTRFLSRKSHRERGSAN